MMMMTYQTSCELELRPIVDCSTPKGLHPAKNLAYIALLVHFGIPSVPSPAVQGNQSTLLIISFNNGCSDGINFSIKMQIEISITKRPI